jgi:hypothetical protein
VIVRGTAESQPRASEHSSQGKGKEQVSFHDRASFAQYPTTGIMAYAATHSNEEEVPFIYLFHIVANY